MKLHTLVRKTILGHFPALLQSDVSQGVDVKLSPAALEVLPWAIEAKSVEKLNIWQAWNQASANSKDLNPVLIFKRARQKPLAVVDLSYLLSLHVDNDALAKRILKVTK